MSDNSHTLAHTIDRTVTYEVPAEVLAEVALRTSPDGGSSAIDAILDGSEE